MLTFDKIREIERTEKDLRKLQKLPDDLLEQIKEYLQRKENMKEKTSSEIRELENVKSTIKKFFEYRENKIIATALDCVRTGIPPENLTKQEEKIFYEIVDKLKYHREKFFEDIHKAPQSEANFEEEKKLEEIENEMEINAEKEEHKEKVEIFPKEEKQYAYKVRKAMPAFVGSDMNTYEFKQDDVIGLDALPKPLNDLLLKEGVIEQIEI